MTERAHNADICRKPQIFADSPLLLEIPAPGGRRKPRKTADCRRKPKIFAENCRKLQIGLRHLRCVTFSSALFSKIRLNRFLGLAMWKEGLALRAENPLINLVRHRLALRSRPPFTGVLQGPGPESAPRSAFLGDFGHLTPSAPKSAFWVFLALLGLKKRQKAQNHSKSTPGGTFRPGSLEHSCNGGQDRKPR